MSSISETRWGRRRLAEETSAQRRIIDAQLAEGLDDIRNERVSRRFDTADEMLDALKEKSSIEGA